MKNRKRAATLCRMKVIDQMRRRLGADSAGGGGPDSRVSFWFGDRVYHVDMALIIKIGRMLDRNGLL